MSLDDPGLGRGTARCNVARSKPGELGHLRVSFDDMPEMRSDRRTRLVRIVDTVADEPVTVRGVAHLAWWSPPLSTLRCTTAPSCAGEPVPAKGNGMRRSISCGSVIRSDCLRPACSASHSKLPVVAAPKRQAMSPEARSEDRQFGADRLTLRGFLLRASPTPRHDHGSRR